MKQRKLKKKKKEKNEENKNEESKSDLKKIEEESKIEEEVKDPIADKIWSCLLGNIKKSIKTMNLIVFLLAIIGASNDEEKLKPYKC